MQSAAFAREGPNATCSAQCCFDGFLHVTCMLPQFDVNDCSLSCPVPPPPPCCVVHVAAGLTSQLAASTMMLWRSLLSCSGPSLSSLVHLLTAAISTTSACVPLQVCCTRVHRVCCAVLCWLQLLFVYI